jgi:hypothetical protein
MEILPELRCVTGILRADELPNEYGADIHGEKIGKGNND